MSTKVKKSLAIAFMTRSRHNLEWQSILLASCWRNFFQQKVSLYAFYNPQSSSDFSDRTLKSFKNLHVDLRPLSIPADFDPVYPIGNKIRLAAEKFEEEFILFCDSDLLVAKDFSLDLFTNEDFSAAVAGALTWGSDEEWAYLYKKFSLPAPRIWLPLQNGAQSRPYFNAGLVGWRNSTNLGKTWLDIALKIDADDLVNNKRPWLDQIALPIAVSKANSGVNIVSERYNTTPSQSTFKPGVSIFHYHGQRKLYEHKLNVLASECLKLSNSGFSNFYDLVTHIQIRFPGRGEQSSHATNTNHEHDAPLKIFSYCPGLPPSTNSRPEDFSSA